MHHPTYMPPPSVVGTILAASDISGLTVLGELPDWVVQWMALPERVTKVQADNRVMFHWAQHAAQKQHDLRGDTATYQWVGKSARAVVANPYALLPGDKDRTYQIIGTVEPPNPLYPTIQYLRLVLKYVPGTQASSGTPELWLDTYTPHSQDSIRPYLRKAVIVGRKRRHRR
jgi:hypothetical protein